MTREALEKAALRYLGRYESTAAELTRVLRNKVKKATQRGAELDEGKVEADIELVVAACLDRGLVDDERFARFTVERLRRQGASLRAIKERLSFKGVDPKIVERILGEESEDTTPEEVELAAARAYARRRRLGPHRPAAARPERRQRDLASMARAGFSFDMARRVIDEELEED